MPKLTDSQLVILSAAAQRDGNAALPLPKSLKLNKGAAATVLKSLVKRGLLAEQPARGKKAIWREDRDGTPITLAITDDGLTAIGVEPAQDADAKATPATGRRKARKGKTRAAAVTTTPNKTRNQRPSGKAEGSKPAANQGVSGIRPGTKQDLLIALLARKQGVTIAEAVEATGWQAHSVRGAISGALKKKLGLSVISEPHKSRGRVYRIAGR